MSNIMIINIMNTLVVIAAGLYALFSKTEKSADQRSPGSKKLYAIIVTLISAAALFVRIYRFGDVPAGINQDEAMAAVDALALSSHGTDRFGMSWPVHFTAWGFGQMSVLLSYIMAVFYKLFGMSDITTRLPILIASLCGMAALFFLVKKIAGTKMAVLALLLIAINPWHIMQSRWSLDCNMFPHFVMFGMLFLYKGLYKSRYLYISMIFFALSMYAYGIAFVSVPLLLAGICVYLLVKKLVSTKDTLICLGIYFLISWPIYAVMIINTLKLPTIEAAFFTIPYFPNSVRMNDLVFFSDSPFKQLISNLVSLIDCVLIQKQDLPWNSITDFGPLYIMTIPLFVVGLTSLVFKKIKDSRRRAGTFFLLIWLGVAVFAGLVTNDVNINRINIIFYPLIIISAFGLNYITTSFSKKIITCVITGLLAITFVFFSTTYFGDYSTLLGNYYFNGYGKSVQYAENSGFDIIYITANTYYGYTPHINEILTNYYAQTDALYLQGKADAYDNNSAKLLPYNERYLYIDPVYINSYDLNSAAIILELNEAAYLDSYGEFDVFIFDNYCVAVLRE